jgi:hypothetical protein
VITVRGTLKLLVVLISLSIIAGLVIVAAADVRSRANMIRCQSNLKQIGMALHNYQDFYKHLPSGTVSNPDLPPDQRLSWMTGIWPSFMEGGIATKLDRTRAWDAEENCPVVLRVKEIREDGTHGYDERVLAELKAFKCPSNPSRPAPGEPDPTHYVGIAGVGEDAADLPDSDRRIGFFGYDRIVSLENIKDGVSSTLLVVEIGDCGPWTAGGKATVRGLASGRPYLGEGGQFSTHHRGTARDGKPLVTHVMLGDGAVYPISSSISKTVFEAMATINSGEEAGDFPR